MDEADLFALDRAAKHQPTWIKDIAAVRDIFLAAVVQNVPVDFATSTAQEGKHPSPSPSLDEH